MMMGNAYISTYTVLNVLRIITHLILKKLHEVVPLVIPIYR